MKTLVASLITCLLAAPAVAGPDFTTRTPRAHSLAASPATTEIGPLDDIVFTHDSAELTEAAAVQIQSAARWLRQAKDRLVLEGYADSTGFSLYNEDLALRRAQTVRAALIRAGVAADRIVVVGFGEEAAVGGDNPLDRRVVMYATKLSPQQIAAKSFAHKHALTAAWTSGRALFTETRRRSQPTGTVIGTR